MLKKEMNQLRQMEKYYEQLSDNEIMNNLLREDFYKYDQIYKNKQLLFDEPKKCEDRIFELIESCDEGSYQQLQQLQNRIDYMLSISENSDTLSRLKNKYLCERRSIVQSGLTIAQMMDSYRNIGMNTSNDSLTILIKQYFENKSMRSRFIWQFLDQLFIAFDTKQQSQNLNINKEVKNQHQQNSEYMKQKKSQLLDMLKKLDILLKSNGLQQIQQQISKRELPQI